MALAAIFAFDTAVALMAAQAAGRYNVLGYQIQKKSAETIEDNVLVECYIDNARVDWERCTRNGPKEHIVRIKVQFTAVQPAKADLAVLENPASSDAQRAVALSNLTSPSLETSKTLMDAWAAVFEVLDDARNLTFGLTTGSISDKEYTDFQQDEFPGRGGPGILTATSFLTFRVKEAQLGDVGTEPDPVIYDTEIQGSDLDENVDTTTQTGVVTEIDT